MDKARKCHLLFKNISTRPLDPYWTGEPPDELQSQHGASAEPKSTVAASLRDPNLESQHEVAVVDYFTTAYPALHDFQAQSTYSTYPVPNAESHRARGYPCISNSLRSVFPNTPLQMPIFTKSPPKLSNSTCHRQPMEVIKESLNPQHRVCMEERIKRMELNELHIQQQQEEEAEVYIRRVNQQVREAACAREQLSNHLSWARRIRKAERDLAEMKMLSSFFEYSNSGTVFETSFSLSIFTVSGAVSPSKPLKKTEPSIPFVSATPISTPAHTSHSTPFATHSKLTSSLLSQQHKAQAGTSLHLAPLEIIDPLSNLPCDTSSDTGNHAAPSITELLTPSHGILKHQFPSSENGKFEVDTFPSEFSELKMHPCLNTDSQECILPF